jgi:hypothetical protein
VSQSTICFLILGAVLALFIWNRLPIGIVALGAALSLYATGILNLNQALAGFGDPVVIFIASLFVVSEALDATGVTTWVGQQLVARVGSSQFRLLMLTMLLSAALSALITPNGAVAALMPMAVILAMRLERLPALLLMPLAFGAHAGSLLMLTGTGINVIVSEAAVDAGLGGFGFSSSRSLAYRCCSARLLSSSCSGNACCHGGPRSRCHPISAITPDSCSSTTICQVAWSGCGWSAARRWSEHRAPS